jgi:aryl-alcohol dehydrogenase-like predicted oxidoreductase
MGVNHFDNADVYGNGRAEKILAKALGDRNKKVVIATKVGWNKNEFESAYDPRNIRRQCEASLKNLNRDYADIYYFHHCDFGPDDRFLEAGLSEFRKLKAEGKIRAIGLSGYSADDFLRLIPKISPDCVQSWANVLHPDFISEDSPVAAIMKKEGITFVAFNPLSRGLLTGKFTAKNPPKFDENDVRYTMEEFKPDYLARFEPRLEKIKSRFGSAPNDLVRFALQYILFHKVTACAIPGFRNKKQVEINLSAADRPLSNDEFAFIKETFKGL